MPCRMLWVAGASVTSSDASPPRIASFCWTSGSTMIIAPIAPSPRDILHVCAKSITQTCKHTGEGEGRSKILIEASDSTVAYDRGEKIPRYAAIPEAWIVDLAQQIVPAAVIEVFSVGYEEKTSAPTAR